MSDRRSTGTDDRTPGDHAVALAEAAAEHLAARLAGFTPEVLLTLGSGLGALAEDLQDTTIITFEEAGLPDTTVPGHAGRLVAGTLHDVPVLCQQGRVHLYEGRDIADVVACVRAAATLGAHTFVATNAAGGIGAGEEDDPRPGDLMAITDHLNLTGENPLIGQATPHFLDLKDAYDPGLRAAAHRVADTLDEPLREGIYAGLKGPSFETPAEIRWLRTIGADAVGMSTVAEVIAARAAGLRVAGFSLLTNVHLPGGSHTDHQEVIDVGGQAGPRLARLLAAWLPTVGAGHATPGRE